MFRDEANQQKEPGVLEVLEKAETQRQRTLIFKMTQAQLYFSYGFVFPRKHMVGVTKLQWTLYVKQRETSFLCCVSQFTSNKTL